MADRLNIRMSHPQGVLIGPNGRQENKWQIILNPRIAILAIVVAAVLGVAVIWVLQQGKGPDVRLVAMRLGPPAVVDGTGFESGTRGDGTEYREDYGPSPIDATPIDITLKNSGATSAVVLEAQVTIVFGKELEDCAQTGGPLQVEADYDVKLPRGLTAVPLTVTREMRFEVEPHASERFTLTVGPETQGVESWDARAYVADVSLKLDYTAEPLTVGRAAWMTRAGDGFSNLSQGIGGIATDCLRTNSQTMSTFGALGGVRSDEAGALIKRYSHLTAPNGDVRQPVCSYTRAGAVSHVCALYTKDFFMASVGPDGGAAAQGSRVLVRLATKSGEVRHIVQCRLTEDSETHEQQIEAPGTVSAAAGSCSEYDPDYGTAWVFAYPSTELAEGAMMIIAELLGPGQAAAILVNRMG
ncbi:hypothetical protein GCM10009557_43880 [Virgisporangium ochraceum]